MRERYDKGSDVAHWRGLLKTHSKAPTDGIKCSLA